MNTGRLRSVSFCPSGTARTTLMLALAFCVGISCTTPPVKTESAPTPAQRSNIKIDVRLGGPVVVTTSTAEFQILPSGHVQASLLKGDQRLTLDDSGNSSSDFLVHDGKEIPFALDLGQVRIQDSVGKLGRGKRLEIPSHPLDAVRDRHPTYGAGPGLRRFSQHAAIECGIQEYRQGRFTY